MNPDQIPIPAPETRQSARSIKLPVKSMKYTCDLCHKSFSSKHCLSEHNYKHNNLKPYNCQNCNESFRYASQIAVHRRSCQVSSPAPISVSQNMVNKYIEFHLPSTQKVEIDLNPITFPQEVVLPGLKDAFPDIFS